MNIKLSYNYARFNRHAFHSRGCLLSYSCLMKYRIGFFLLKALIFSACGISGVVTYECGEPVFVQDFPVQVDLPSSSPVEGDFMGAVVLYGSDSVFAAMTPGTDNFLKLYSSDFGTPRAEMWHKGDGPDEFSYPPSIVGFDSRDGVTSITAYYRPDASLHFWKVSGEGEILSHVEKAVTDSMGSVKQVVELGDSSYLLVSHAYETGCFYRYILKDNIVSLVPNMGRQYERLPDIDCNLISFIPYASPDGTKMVEGHISLDQINLYSLRDTTFRKTIVVGSRLDNLLELGGIFGKDVPYTYSFGQTFDDCFVMLYHGLDKGDYYSGKGTSQLRFFSWNGEPLLRINVPLVAVSFHIDSIGNLYLFTPFGETENVYKYDISSTLDNLHKEF